MSPSVDLSINNEYFIESVIFINVGSMECPRVTYISYIYFELPIALAFNLQQNVSTTNNPII